MRKKEEAIYILLVSVFYKRIIEQADPFEMIAVAFMIDEYQERRN